MFPVEQKALPQNRQRPLSELELQERGEKARQRYLEKMVSLTIIDADGQHLQSSVVKADPAENAKGLIPLPETSQTNGHSDDDRVQDGHVFVAFARIFSGTGRRGQRLYVLGTKHDPDTALQQNVEEDMANIPESVHKLGSTQHITTFVVQDLYMFMGRELELLDTVPAGNVLGIGGLEDHILKSATVSSTVACPAFTDMYFDAAPILRVAVEPVSPGDMSRLVEGLRLLNQADPCVRVLVQETGEHVIVTAGEIHLQRCVDDLRNRYSKVEVNVSQPIVPFRETIIPRPRMDRVNEAIQDQNTVLQVSRQNMSKDDDEVIGEGLVEMYTPNHLCVVQIRALPLPSGVVECILRHQDVIKTLDALAADQAGQLCDLQAGFKMQAGTRQELNSLHSELKQEFESAGKQWSDAVDHIWAFGPRRNGPNILLNKVLRYKRLSMWSVVDNDSGGMCEDERTVREHDSSIIAGFQMATQAGPLCEEPMHGVCFIIERWEDVDVNEEAEHPVRVLEDSLCHDDLKQNRHCPQKHAGISSDSHRRQNKMCADSKSSNTKDEDSLSVNSDNSDGNQVRSKIKDVFGPMSGQLMSIIKDGCRKAFQTMPQRLMVAMYQCTIQATTDVLGKLYAVIGKRNGRVISEELREGTQIFNVLAEFPVVESFGLAEEMRKRTSGLASPQLRFSHWEVLDIDPFWVPSTEEEYVHFGEKADSENRARAYMNEVRRRKGLKVDEKIVEFAEKQRTLNRKK